MIDREVQWLRDVAKTVPDHLPVIAWVYDKVKADSIVENSESAPLTDDEWKQAFNEFIRWVDEPMGIIWEALTATSLIQSGADLLVMRHPKAAQIVNMHIETLFKE